MGRWANTIFYSNVSFENDVVIYSRVGDHNMNNFLDVYLEDFEYPENESPYTTSHLLHNDDNFA